MHSHTLSLNEADLALFARFGIGGDVLREAGVRRVSDAEAREQLNSSHRGDLAGIMFPYVDPTSGHVVTARVRRDHPEVDQAGKPLAKYLAATGDQPHVYFGPGAGPLLADTAAPVVIIESEKAALTLVAAARRAQRPLLVIALGGCWGWRTQRAGKATDAAGARVNQPGVQPDLGRVVWADRDVVILFDANAATNPKVRQAGRGLADDLQARGARVLIGTVPAEPGVNGPDDHRLAHDDAALLALIDNAVPVQPATVDKLLDDCELLTLPAGVDAANLEPRLRRLRDALHGADAIRRAAVRSKLMAVMKAAKVPGAAALVDAAIGAADADTPSSTPASSATFLHDAEPWPEPVDDLAGVLDALVALFERYVVLPAHGAYAIALWAAHTFLVDWLPLTPILNLASPVKQSGKTRTFEILGRVVQRPLAVASATQATLFRLMDQYQPTLLADEADAWLGDDANGLRGAINAGWKRTNSLFPRCDPQTFEVQFFDVFGCKALAGIANGKHALPDTILDRSIVLTLRRRAKHEHVDRLRDDVLETEAEPIRRKLRRWAADAGADVVCRDPAYLEPLSDRGNDNWRSLRQIALAAGGSWPERADVAAVALSSGEAVADDGDVSVLLLRDIQEILDDHHEAAIFTADLITKLTTLDERPWATWRKGEKLNPWGLSKLLKPFGIRSAGTVRSGASTAKGYWKSDFLDAIGRYTPSEPSQPSQPNVYGPESTISTVTANTTCDGSKHANSSMFTGLETVVTVENGNFPVSEEIEV